MSWLQSASSFVGSTVGAVVSGGVNLAANFLTGVGSVMNYGFSAAGLNDLGRGIGNILTPGGAPYTPGTNASQQPFSWRPIPNASQDNNLYNPFSFSAFGQSMFGLDTVGRGSSDQIKLAAADPSQASGSTDLINNQSSSAGTADPSVAPKPRAESDTRSVGEDVVPPPSQPDLNPRTYDDFFDEELGASAFFPDRKWSADLVERADQTLEYKDIALSAAGRAAEGDAALQARLFQVEGNLASKAQNLEAARIDYETAKLAVGSPGPGASADPGAPRALAQAERRLSAAQAGLKMAVDANIGSIFSPDKAKQSNDGKILGLSSRAGDLKLVTPAFGAKQPGDDLAGRKLNQATRLVEEARRLNETDATTASGLLLQAEALLEDAEAANDALGRSTYKDGFWVKNRVTGERVEVDWAGVTSWLSIATTFGLTLLQQEMQSRADEKNRRYQDKVRQEEREERARLQTERLNAQLQVAEINAAGSSPAAVGASRTHTIGGGVHSA